MLDGFLMVFKGIFYGIVQIFNFPYYLKLWSNEGANFGVLDWILSILSFILIVAVWIAIFCLIVLAVKKRIRYKKALLSNEDLLEEITDLNREVVRLNNEKERVMQLKITQAGLSYEIYSNIKANPTIENVQTGVAAFKKSGADYIIAIGGGSSMDTAKAIGIIIANPEFEDVRSLEGVAPTRKPCVPIIAVPTTAGTAAEVTINYVITDVERKRKFVCVDPHDMPIIAVVDPEMMSSMPKGLTASTGMDALTHAIEGYTTKAAWEMTDMFHLKAIEIISKSLRGAVANTPEGREGMALGQYIAGMGFSNVGLGIAHSMAHTLGAVYDTPHGVACAMMLPIVMEYNADCTGEKYREIARAMGVEGVDAMSQEEYRKAAVAAVRKLSEDVGIPSKLEAIKESDLDFLAESAHADACAPGNPKDASVEDLKELFRKIM